MVMYCDIEVDFCKVKIVVQGSGVEFFVVVMRMMIVVVEFEMMFGLNEVIIDQIKIV